MKLWLKEGKKVASMEETTALNFKQSGSLNDSFREFLYLSNFIFTWLLKKGTPQTYFIE